MNELTKNNGEKRKTENISGRSQDSELQNHAGSMGASTRAGKPDWTDQISTDRAIGKGTTSDKSVIAGGNTIIGKILRQLIWQSRNQVAHRNEDIQRIQLQIQEFETQIAEWEKLLDTLEESESKHN